MAARKKAPASAARSRFAVVALGDEDTFREVVLESLDGRDRLAREAALEALVERPLADLRPRLRQLFGEISADPAKLDPGAHLRLLTARIIMEFEDRRDADIALQAISTYETSMGVDSTGNLRAVGLKILAAADPDLFPYIAVEHVDDASEFSPEPANTAIQLLAATGHQLAVYQWFQSGWRDPALLESALGLMDEVPAIVMSRCVARLMRDAIEKEDEPLLTKLAEVIVERELEDSYSALSSLMRAPVSKELYEYLALLLAGTNRPALLEILREQLRGDMRRRPAILAALAVRTTPEQQAILDAWEQDGE